MVNKLTGRIAVPIAAALTLLATPLAASAAGNEGSPLINPEGKGSITIVKLASRAEIPLDAKANGAVVNGLSDDPSEVYRIPGVRFSVRQLTGYDLTTEQGWEAAKELIEVAAEDPNSLKNVALFPGENSQTGCTGWKSITDAAVASGGSATAIAAAAGHAGHCEGVTLETPDPATQPDGQLKFSGLDVGLYVVSEEGTPENVIPAVPFLVTIPMTNPAPGKSAEWMYDVTVYPKNAITGVTKSVLDDDLLLGDNLGDSNGRDVTYKITMPVPEETTKLVITDVLDPSLGFSLSDESFRLLGELSDAKWTADYDEDGYWEAQIGSDVLVQYGKLDDVERTLRVTFTGPVSDGIPGMISKENVGFTFDATIDLSESTSGVISNTATYSVTVAGGTAIGESTVQTKWGGVNVQKSASGGVPLEGAFFNVAASLKDAEDGKYLFADDIASDEDGLLTLDGLRYSEWVNGNPVGTGEGQTYYLVETSAPAGYVRKTDPIPFTVTGLAADATPIVLTNEHQAGFDLPTIGGNRAILPILGGLVVAGGVVWLVRSRRVND